MDTTLLLNHYRLSIVEDRLAILLLSRLYRDGPKTEAQLSLDLNTADEELRQELTKLYRANLIHIITPEKWGITELSEEVLTRIGISQVASKSLLAAQSIPRPDLIFLNACIEAKADDIHWSKQQTALLKSLSNVVGVLRSQQGRPKADATRLMYAMIVGLDPDIQRLGEKDYCRLVVEKHQELKNYELENRWSEKCWQATKDVHSSNHLFLYGAQPEDADWHIACPLSWSRVLSTFLTNSGDDDLRTAFLAKKEVVSEVWTPLRTWLSDIEEMSFQFLSSSGKLKPRLQTGDNQSILLRMMLLEILTRSMRESHDQYLRAESFLLESKKELTDSRQISSMIRVLNLFKSEVEAGQYKNVLATQRDHLCELLNALLAALNARRSDEEKVDTPVKLRDVDSVGGFETSAVAGLANQSNRSRSGGHQAAVQRSAYAMRITNRGVSILRRAETSVGDSVPKVSYEMPSIDLLAVAPARSEITDDELLRTAEKISKSFEKLKVPGQIKFICPGPVVTIYEFKPDPGVKYSRITDSIDDLYVALKDKSIRIERIPGKPHVGIEVPNPRRETIYLREVIESRAFRESSSKLTIALGKTTEGLNYVIDLTKMPHLLMAGITGSGKSVGIKTLLVSILYRARPDEVKLILIDPKRLEFGLFEDIPHLATPIIVDPKAASRSLRWAVGEMEQRYKELADWGVRNIDDYNAERDRRNSIKDFDENGAPWTHLPYIVIVIHELADLMITSGPQVEDSIARLAQMARAVGIHLVIATQQSSVDVITGLIKANVPARISYRMSSSVDSRAVLDTNGAEQLLGYGDMLFSPPGSARLLRLHGAYVDQAEIEHIVQHVRTQWKPEYDVGITQSVDDTFDLPRADKQDDEMFAKALHICVDMKRASTSVLQRRLRIGYERAATLLDRMEREGLIGKAEGARPRPILEKAYRMLAQLDQSVTNESQ
jgi:hypothetical protein